MKIKLFSIFKILFFLSALSSYAILGIPIQWLGLLLACGILFLLVLKKELNISKTQLPIFIFVAWSFLITLVSMQFSTFSMPENASTAYSAFIFLRLLKLLAFISMVVITLNILKRYGFINTSMHLSNIGFLIALYSFYTYFATLYNLPEIPRTRVGTSGGEATTTFTYAFHRATGTFLEPSHLGEWLTLPFLLSFIDKRRFVVFKRFTMGLVIMLTGSFGTILSIFLALGLTVLGLLIDFRRRLLMLNMLKTLFLAILLGTLSFLFINLILSGLFIDQLSERLYQIVGSGLAGSNRGYVYLFLENNPIPFIGYGLGISNLLLTNSFGSPAMMSFLSLYINTLYSSGIIGFIILITALFYPLFLVVMNTGRNEKINVFYVVWTYITLLILFIVNMEELTITFAISYALLFNFLNFEKHGL